MRDFLSDVRAGGGLKRILDLIESVRDYRVLLIGDYIKDEYVYVDVLGKSPKESMIAVQRHSVESWGGGVLAAARHLAWFVKHVDLLTIVHSKPQKESENIPKNVFLEAIYSRNCTTTKKTRFVERSYMRKLFEVYQMDDRPPGEQQLEDLRRLIWQASENADLIMVADFGHGLIDHSIVHKLATIDKFLAVAPQTNSANVGFNLLTKYKHAGVAFSCLDEPEARLAAGYKHQPIDRIGLQLLEEIGGKLIITHGQKGCYVFGYHGSNFRKSVPALTDTVVDTVGAGDAFFSITAPMVKAGGHMDDIGLIGNAAGALKVGIVGHRASVAKPALIDFITGLLK